MAYGEKKTYFFYCLKNSVGNAWSLQQGETQIFDDLD